MGQAFICFRKYCSTTRHTDITKGVECADQLNLCHIKCMNQQFRLACACIQARHTFTSPADLLRTLNSEGYLQAQLEQARRVRESYEVCCGCCCPPTTHASTDKVGFIQIHTGSPWVTSRPVYVLFQQQPNSDAPLTYSLRTKVSWSAAEDELSKVVYQLCAVVAST